MLVSSYGNMWNYIDGNLFTDQPATGMGTSFSITAGSKSSWTTLISAVTYDCYEIIININGVFTNASAVNYIVDIGIDVTGGTSYVPLIENLLGKSTQFTVTMGQTYTFPLFIPAGASLAVRGQRDIGTGAAGGHCAIMIKGLPSKPDELVYGYGVETIGISGTTGTPVASTNAASMGSYTTIGTTTKNLKAIQMGWTISNATITALGYRFDLAYGTNDERISLDLIGTPTNTEQLHVTQNKIYCDIPAGVDVKAHIWCSGTGTINQSIALYGVY